MTPAGRTLWAGRLGVEFLWTGDRFAHRILLRAAPPATENAATVWLESIERLDGSGAGAATPASPVLQELHIEPRPEGVTAALLVGRVGSQHCSASVSIDPANEQLLFELACRVRGPGGPLGSAYRVATPSTNAARCGEWAVAPLDRSDSPTLLCADDRQLAIAVPANAGTAYPATICWSYSIKRSA